MQPFPAMVELGHWSRLMNIAWGRGFFRIWVLLSVVWIGGAIWIESNPPVQSGPPPPFDETLPYLKTVPGVMDKLSDSEPAAKQDPRVDLQNCVEYFRDEQSQTMWRYVRWTTLGSCAAACNPVFRCGDWLGFAGFSTRIRTDIRSGEGRSVADT